MALKWNIAALWALLEASFKVDPDGSGATYKFQKATEITFQPSADVIERPAMTFDLVRQEHVIGAKGGKLGFKLEVKASGTPAGSAVVAIAAEADQVLQSYFGTVVRGTGVLTAAGSTTTNVSVTSSAGFAKGMLAEIAGTGTGGVNEQRFISAIPDGTHLTLERATTNPAGNGVVVYASSLYKRAQTGHKSLAFTAKRDTGVEYTFLGCKVNSLKLEGINAKGTALFAVDVEVGTWSVTTKASLPSSDLTGITAVKAPVVKGSAVSVSGTTEFVQGLDIDPGHSFAYQTTTEDADAKSGMELVGAGPKGALRAWFAGGHLTDFAAGTSKTLAFACGDRTNGFGIYAQKVQWGQPALTNKDGMVGEDIPFFCNDNGTDPEIWLCLF